VYAYVVCTRVRACVRVCTRVYACVRVCTRVCARVCTPFYLRVCCSESVSVPYSKHVPVRSQVSTNSSNNHSLFHSIVYLKKAPCLSEQRCLRRCCCRCSLSLSLSLSFHSCFLLYFRVSCLSAVEDLRTTLVRLVCSSSSGSVVPVCLAAI